MRGEPSACAQAPMGTPRRLPGGGGPGLGVAEDVCTVPRTPLDDSVGRMEDILEEVAQHREPEALQQCLRKVRPGGWGTFSRPLVPTEGPGVGPSPQRASVFPGMQWAQSWGSRRARWAPGPALSISAAPHWQALSSSLHPLGKLLRTLMLTFQATYAGFGANKHLQGLALEEVKQHAQELWAAYR